MKYIISKIQSHQLANNLLDMNRLKSDLNDHTHKGGNNNHECFASIENIIDSSEKNVIIGHYVWHQEKNVKQLSNDYTIEPSQKIDKYITDDLRFLCIKYNDNYYVIHQSRPSDFETINHSPNDFRQNFKQECGLTLENVGPLSILHSLKQFNTLKSITVDMKNREFKKTLNLLLHNQLRNLHDDLPIAFERDFKEKKWVENAENQNEFAIELRDFVTDYTTWLNSRGETDSLDSFMDYINSQNFNHNLKRIHAVAVLSNYYKDIDCEIIGQINNDINQTWILNSKYYHNDDSFINVMSDSRTQNKILVSRTIDKLNTLLNNFTNN